MVSAMPHGGFWFNPGPGRVLFVKVGVTLPSAGASASYGMEYGPA